jgi:hypothetical protein
MKQFILLAILFTVFVNSSLAQKQRKDCITFKFNYLVTSNILQSSTVREIDIFLDEKAFSEDKLKILFTYFSAKYPKVKILIVKVKTNWAQLQPPSDCPPSGESNQPDNPDEYDYHFAVYRRERNDNSEYFTYNPILKTRHLETRTLKTTE